MSGVDAVVIALFFPTGGAAVVEETAPLYSVSTNNQSGDTMKYIGSAIGAATLLAIAACTETPTDATNGAAAEDSAATSEDAAEPVALAVAASGAYKTDPRHAYITFSYNHQGMSNPHIRWRNWTGELDWNAEDPAASAISVTIDAASVDSGVDIFDGHLRSANFFDVDAYPEITFKSTSIERTGPNTGKIKGDLTIKGNTRSVTLDAVINGTAHDPENKIYKLGFTGTTSVNRSDFSVDAYVPYISDKVDIVINAEFVRSYAEG